MFTFLRRDLQCLPMAELIYCLSLFCFFQILFQLCTLDSITHFVCKSVHWPSHHFQMACCVVTGRGSNANLLSCQLKFPKKLSVGVLVHWLVCLSVPECLQQIFWPKSDFICSTTHGQWYATGKIMYRDLFASEKPGELPYHCLGYIH